MSGRTKQIAVIIGVVLIVLILNIEIMTHHTTNQLNLPLSGRVIVIDAGHGGPDGGAEGGDVQEKKIALAIAKKVQDYLQESGALVLMTREEDIDRAKKDTKGLSRRKTEDLLSRAKFINDSDADAMVSIHLNAIPSARWKGAQTFFHPKSDENEKLAIFIQDSLKSDMKNTKRYAKAIQHVYLLKKAEMPSALVEVGFLSNPEERQKLDSNQYQNQLAESIAFGIMRYFTDEKTPGNGPES